MSAARIDVSADAAALAVRAAQWITDLACHTAGRFSVCLSGGSTPKRLYETLAAAPFRDVLPWQRVHWFFGDDRFVPRDHPDSNYGMAHEAMLARAPVPPENIHGIKTDGAIAECAAAYQADLGVYYGTDRLDPARPLFDVMLLGMGPDGHTASLFPHKPALDERARWAVAVPEPGLNPFVPRITLTFPAIESCRSAAFLVAGADKTVMMRRVMGGDRSLPSACVAPVGELVWFIDRAAEASA
ncbi:MAG: 6-phosphogluconolactonase [Stellaceae bacterium]